MLKCVKESVNRRGRLSGRALVLERHMTCRGMALVWGRLFGHPSFQRLTAMVIDDNNDFSRALTAIRKPTINLGVFPNDIDRALRGFSATAELVRS